MTHASTPPHDATPDPLSPSWVYPELETVDLGDKRLQRRVLDSAAKLAALPTASINQACDGWADSKATYRLFDHEAVTPAALRAPHVARTRQRMAHHARVFAVQDTTYLDYTSHPQTAGLGPLSRANQPHLRGLVMHSTLAFTEEGLPLGVLDQQLWARDEFEERDARAQAQRPIEEKESFKWIKALRATVTHTPPEVEVVTICDREADIYELFAEAERLQTGLLVRAYVERATVAEEEGPLAQARLWQQVAQRPVVGTLEVTIPAQRGRPSRVAHLTVRYQTVRIQASGGRVASQEVPVPPTLTLSALLIEEEDAPDEKAPLCWKLVTNCQVHNPLQALERVDWYCLRWGIEVYHKVLKSGCTVEQCGLQSALRLQRYLALMGIIAWRLHWLTLVNRAQPAAPCTSVLAEVEWRALYATIHKTTTLPAEVPTVRQAVRWIAHLGGFLGRTHDGEPGVTVIWRGWQRLHDLAQTYALFHLPDTYG